MATPSPFPLPPPVQPQDPGFFKKIFNEVVDNPKEHLVLLGTSFTLVTGICAWQYCRGYFKALGINISYAHVDNLLFVFEQLTQVNMYSSKFLSIKNVLMVLCASILATIALLFLRKYLTPKLSKSKSDEELRNSNVFQIFGSILSLVAILLTTVFLLKNKNFNGASVVATACIFIYSVIVFFNEFISRSPQRKAHYGIYWFVGVLLIINVFNGIGTLDGNYVKSTKYKNLDTICLSRPANEFESKTSGELLCGKLIFADSSQICIQERSATYPHCRIKDKYEITLIPNIP